MSATFFVATSFLDGGRMWNDSVIEVVRGYRGKTLNLNELGLGFYGLETVDQRRFAIDDLLSSIKYLDVENRSGVIERLIDFAGCHLPTNLMMSSEQVLSLRKSGMQIGAHTCSHPILELIADNQAEEEIRGSKLILESLLSEPVSLFAYPNGKPDIDYSARHVAMVRDAGFSAAVSTSPGVSMQSSDVFQLPRFTPWDRTRFRYGIRMLTNLRLDVHRVSESS